MRTGVSSLKSGDRRGRQRVARLRCVSRRAETHQNQQPDPNGDFDGHAVDGATSGRIRYGLALAGLIAVPLENIHNWPSPAAKAAETQC